MASRAMVDGSDIAGPIGLTTQRTLALMAFATFVWFCAAMFIRYAGPGDLFVGWRGALLYAVTIVATMPLNVRTRKIAGVARAGTLTAVAVTSATATMLDGVAMTYFPGLYGDDPVRTGAAAAWLLWAIGVGLALALMTSLRTARR